MTTLREAAQQALEALEGWDNYGKWVWPESALEQAKRNTTESLAALRAALEQAEPEPVAWMVVVDGGTSAYVTDNPRDLIGAYRALPLYTAPTQRKPLTDDRLWELWNIDSDKAYENCPTYFQEFRYTARLVEWAHGIGEEK